MKLTVTVSGGFKSKVVFSAGTLPSGLSASFLPTSLPSPGSGSTTLTLKLGAQMAAGTYNLTLSATGGGITKTVPLALTVPLNCTSVINPTRASAPATGGRFTATVKINSGCSWNAVSGSPWIAIAGSGAGNGGATVNYSVAINPSVLSRSGSIAIAGQTLRVTQLGLIPH